MSPVVDYRAGAGSLLQAGFNAPLSCPIPGKPDDRDVRTDPEFSRRPKLVVVADDFGKSSSVNRAVAESHEKGLVTAASIMAGGAAFRDAVRLARSLAGLSVGLHVTVCDGRPVLPERDVPGLIGGRGEFLRSPAHAWIRYRRREMLQQLDEEIGAQFDRLLETGIQPTHVDAHHHLHMHPVVFPLVLQHASRRNVRWVRIPAEPLSAAVQPSGRGIVQLLEWAVFQPLSFRRRNQAKRSGLRYPDRVYGLSHTGRLDERLLLVALDHPAAVMEIFAHPDFGTEPGIRELNALTSAAVLKKALMAGVRLTGYRELSQAGEPEAAPTPGL